MPSPPGSHPSRQLTVRLPWHVWARLQALAAAAPVYAPAVEGGVALTGGITLTLSLAPAGGAALGGLAGVSFTVALASTGGAVLGGEAAPPWDALAAASGGAAVRGSARADFRRRHSH
jgi:hypothetical protein